MGIFGDYAAKYHESGFSVIPTVGKLPPKGFDNYQIYGETAPTDDVVDDWCEKYAECNISLLVGKASGVIALDFDYEGSDYQQMEDIVLGIIPPTQIEKRGRRGWTKFYRFNGETSTKKDRLAPGQKNKTRFYDLLSTGKYTVIPPSIHPETGTQYKWGLYSLLDINASDLPFLGSDVIEKLNQLAEMNLASGEIPFQLKSGRHDRIMGYAFRIIESVKTIDELASKLVEYDKKINAENCYFSDRKYFKKNKSEIENALAVAKRFEKSAIKWRKDNFKIDWKIGEKTFDLIKTPDGLFSDLRDIDKSVEKTQAQKEKEELREFERYKRFFDSSWFLKSAVKCSLTDQPYIFMNGEYVELMNHIHTVKSLATDWFLFGNVEAHLFRWCSSLKSRLLIDIPKWDGRKRIDEMLSFVSVRNVPHDVFVDLQKDWLAGIFKRFKNPEHQTHVNMWEGGQGLGKDTLFINKLRGFGRYKNELSGQSKLNDMFADISRSLVVCLPEFDQFDEISPGAMKDLITSPGKLFRAPYDRTSRYFKFKCSFYSTANMSDYLKDTTGNRRFWIFEIDNIDFAYPKFENESGQIVAEIYHLYETNYCAKPESVEMISQFVEEMRTPEDINERIVEIWDARASALMLAKQKTFLSYDDSIEILHGIQSIFKVSHRKLLSILKQAGRKKKLRIGHCYYAKEPIKILSTDHSFK